MIAARAAANPSEIRCLYTPRDLNPEPTDYELALNPTEHAVFNS